MNSVSERECFKVNKEDHLQPILSGYINEAFGNKTDNSKHDPMLLSLIAEQCGCEVKDVVDFELSLYDCQEGGFWGYDEEFIASARLDNQMGCFVSLKGLINHSEKLEEGERLEQGVLVCFR